MKYRSWLIALIIAVTFAGAVTYYARRERATVDADGVHAQIIPSGREAARKATAAPLSTSVVPLARLYGVVVDEAGTPMPDIRISVLLSRLPPGSAQQSPNVRPTENDSEYLTFQSDKDGRFTVEERGFTIQIVGGIRKKPDYVDVFDWAWDWPLQFTSRPRLTNRYFIYGGGFPIYIPDKDRPAIFPLHRKDSSVVGMPSRGGSDQLSDGTIVPNAPSRPLVPSTGPGAPANDTERNERLRKLESLS